MKGRREEGDENNERSYFPLNFIVADLFLLVYM
jgi:hypothetical protein